MTRQETTNVGEDVEKGNPSYVVGGNARWYTLEKSVEVHQKVKNRATHDPAITLLGIYTKDTDLVK